MIPLIENVDDDDLDGDGCMGVVVIVTRRRLTNWRRCWLFEGDTVSDIPTRLLRWSVFTAAGPRMQKKLHLINSKYTRGSTALSLIDLIHFLPFEIVKTWHTNEAFAVLLVAPETAAHTRKRTYMFHSPPHAQTYTHTHFSVPADQICCSFLPFLLIVGRIIRTRILILPG